MLRSIRPLVLTFVSTLGLLAGAACTVGEQAPVRYLDSDGDGETDGIDTDGDGDLDHEVTSCPTCLPGGSPVCVDPLVDSNQDGIPDGLDLDCDGVVDIELGTGGGGGGGGSISQCQSTINERSISCSSADGGPSTCECRVDDVLVSTCSTTSTSACSFGTSSNCCGF
jgi:hypothetical protein